MTAAEFKKKWARYAGKESSAYQEHFTDLCRLLDHPTPAAADSSGTESFCFQKYVVKDADLFLEERGKRPKKGFADVWKKGFFGWEYKGKWKDLDDAYDQLKRYRGALLNPPLMVVCDFNRYIIHTDFTGKAPDKHEFTNAEIDHPHRLELLRHLFFDPEYLKPQRDAADITKELAAKFAVVARSLQEREAVEYRDADSRDAVTVAQKKNLRIARFLNRLVFCFFAESTGLLPKDLFSRIAKIGLEDKPRFTRTLERLFKVMAKGGDFDLHQIRHFNGHLFEDTTVFELNDAELSQLAEAAGHDWQHVQPSIMGELFQRALEFEEDGKLRAQLGAHYTGEADIKTLVEPVLMQPLRREWAALRSRVREVADRRSAASQRRLRADLEAFLKKLRSLIVLDPACGSGNFLYVSLKLLLDLEKEVLDPAEQFGLHDAPQVSVQQLRALEINAYAFELAQVSVQIGYLQWLRDNGFRLDRTPVLQVLDGFQHKDALLVWPFERRFRNLQEAQESEHESKQLQRGYIERRWPDCDVVVGNPPFLGGKLLRRELGDAYVDALFENFGNRVRPEADLCCYWFEKAREQIEAKKCLRAGLLATQGIRGGANRDTLKRIKETGDIFFAVSDRDWILEGANVHISMLGFDDGSEKNRILDSRGVSQITLQLTPAVELHTSKVIETNTGISFMGITPAGPFDVSEETALAWLRSPNPSGRPNSDVLRLYFNGNDLTKRARNVWTVDFGLEMPMEQASRYAEPFGYLDAQVKPVRRMNRREAYARNWWIYAESRPGMREAFASHSRFLATCMVAKHRMFVWLDTVALPANVVIVFGRSDDYSFGILQSRFHEVWALKRGTRLETRPRYTPSTCFETFPFPFPDDLEPPAPTPIKPPPPPKQPEPDRTWAEMQAAHHYFMAKEEPPPYGSSRRRESAVTSDATTAAKQQRGLTSAALKEERCAAIAAAAKELNELRERWLNPPEWTQVEVLEFPASVDGPWARYVDCGGKRSATPLSLGTAAETQSAVAADALPAHSKIGVARYPRLVPKDADCAAKLKKRTLTNLYNERPAWLDLAHKKLDAVVAAAYGWPADLTDEQILERLLALNLERAAEETMAEAKPAPKPQRSCQAGEML